MARFNIKSIEVSNYRLFQALKVDGFTQFNIFGGLNGCGKSTFLEAIFELMDRGNPAAIIRPFQWRLSSGPLVNTADAVSQLFNKGDINNVVKVSAIATTGNYSVSYKMGLDGLTLPATSIQVGLSSPSAEGVSTVAPPQGMLIQGTFNGVVDLSTTVQFMDGGMAAQPTVSPKQQFPRCALLNSVTRRNSPENSARFSKAILNNRRDTILDIVKLVHPSASEVELHFTGGILDIHLRSPGNPWMPLSFLGEGAATLVSVALALFDCSGGVVFLDEFDTTVHHSILQDAWEKVFQMADWWDVQIFCVTHSKESIEAARRASKSIKGDRLSYTRFYKDKAGTPMATLYPPKILESALDDQWEIR